MTWLKLIPWRLVGALAAVAVVAGFIWKAHLNKVELHETRIEKAEAIRQRDQVSADFQAYRDTAERRAKLNRETSNALQTRLSEIERSRTPVSVRCLPATAAAVSAEVRAAAGVDAASERGGAETPLRDIGPALEDARIEAQRNNARYLTLQDWERSRKD